MRRLWAMLLLGLFSFSLIAPAVFASDAGSTLPACCRRNGAHRCSASRGSESGPSVHAARCASYPSAKALPIARTVTLASSSQRVFAEIVAHPATHPQTEARFRISFSRTSQKRGPPSLS